MAMDRDVLATAFDQLKGCSFPGHPDDPDLAEWVLELTELDGHIAGLAVTALASGNAQAADLRDVEDHAEWLREISVVGDDERIYQECLDYIAALGGVENALRGRSSGSR